MVAQSYIPYQSYRIFWCITRTFNTKNKIKIYGYALYAGYKNDRFKKYVKNDEHKIYFYMYLNAVYLKEMTP